MYSGFFVKVSGEVLDKKGMGVCTITFQTDLANTFVASSMPRVTPFAYVVIPIVIAIDDSYTVSNEPPRNATFEGTFHVLQSIAKNPSQSG